MNKKNILVDALQKFGLILLYLSAISCGTSLTATTPMIEPTIPMSVTSDALSATPNQNLLSPTPIITSTPTARLSKEQARELVLELLQPDEDCRFPCWWNIRPGLSEMTSTQSFFNSLSNLAIANRMNDRDGHAFLIITRNEVDMNIDIAYTAEEKQIEWMQVRLCSNVKCDVLSDDPNYLKTIPPYDVSGLLTSYGEPTAIFIFMEKTMGLV